MRVNHAGEVAAQALYHGQALFARNPEVREFMLQAARDETDHLAWCETRLRELGSRTSLLNPLWYAGSFAHRRARGDWSATAPAWGSSPRPSARSTASRSASRNACRQTDVRSRAIVEQMQRDEERPWTASAQSAGGATLPAPVARADAADGASDDAYCVLDLRAL